MSSRNFPRSRLAIVARVEALRRLLRGEFDQAVEFSRAPQLGGVFGLLFVLKQIAQALGIGAALGHRRLAGSATGLGAQSESHAGHVFCCLLALKVSREIERRLRAAFGTTETRADALTLPDALRALTRLGLLHYAVDEKTTVTKLPQPDARQQEILRALGVTLPAM